MKKKIPFSKPHKYECKLTSQQKTFCDAYLANGCNAIDAAKEAGYKIPHVSCAQLMKKSQVKEYLKYNKVSAELRIAKTSSSLPTYEEKLKKLWGIAESGSNGEIISSIVELNKMQGHHSPEKHINIDINTDIDISRIADKIDKLRQQNKSEF